MLPMPGVLLDGVHAAGAALSVVSLLCVRCLRLMHAPWSQHKSLFELLVATRLWMHEQHLVTQLAVSLSRQTRASTDMGASWSQEETEYMRVLSR